jgi:hypothetical protein
MWFHPHSFIYITHLFWGKFFSLDDPKKIQFDSYKGFCEKKALKSPDIKGFLFF